MSVALPDRPWVTDDPCDEIRGLAESAGAVVVGELTQKRQDIQLATYIGSGKLRELQELVETTGADVVVFDNDLGPAQARNLEKAVGVKVLDRSEVILDIFATRAQTLEARLQVELAQLEYSLPRLKNMWSHLSRQKGGGIGLRGPGETQLESDRRLAGGRIRDLKQRLADVQARKEREVRSRGEEYTVSLVGYTNAGKSRLMNALTKAGVYVENKLFSTLDTRTRQWHIKDFGRVLLSDTVGFIRQLPHGLVASFKATLEETRQARLLLHVVDASNPMAEEQIRAVNEVLTELGCDKKPSILVLNKIDRVADRSVVDVLRAHHPRAIAISGLTGEGLADLQEAVIGALSADFAPAEVTTPAGNGKVLAYLNAHAEIFRQEFRGNSIVLRCYLPRHLLRHIEGPEVRVRFLKVEENGHVVATPGPGETPLPPDEMQSI
ncbi:GTPase HflX [Fimbriiglobus ruber]|uniref:GTPase HflX n=1 Tax=Fimbriiglobus ruber TaxID=1908690 RepID=A0A225DSS9_9BACT|nr:GTPase HflX [Fimbriiglobus ruber]OWK44482.1 GTP-binding protein HflX [Fimbriiglobus ruber]